MRGGKLAPNEYDPGESAWVVYDISVAGDELCVVGESDVGGTSGIGDEKGVDGGDN